MFELKIKKLNEDAIIPKFAHKGDAGMDLYSTSEVEIPAGETRLIKTGIAIQLPHMTEAQVRPRSGLALKHGISMANTPGTIDSDYRGEIGVIMINLSKEDFVINPGERIAQLVLGKVYQMDLVEGELSVTERGEGGFGHTGR